MNEDIDMNSMEDVAKLVLREWQDSKMTQALPTSLRSLLDHVFLDACKRTAIKFAEKHAEASMKSAFDDELQNKLMTAARAHLKKTMTSEVQKKASRFAGELVKEVALDEIDCFKDAIRQSTRIVFQNAVAMNMTSSQDKS